MKRNATTFFLLTMLIVLVFALTACNITVSEEYQQYKTVVENVKKNSLDLWNKEGDTASKSANMSLTQQQQDGLLGLLDAYKAPLSREDSDYIKGYFNAVSEVTFNLPLVAGYALSEYKRESKFYGVVVNVEEQGFFMVTDNNGTDFYSKVLVSMSSDPSNDVFYYLNVNYVSETQFDFVVYEIGGEDKGTTCFYGNSNLDFVVLHKEGGFVMFSTTSGGAILNDNNDLVAQCYQYFEESVNAVDKEEMRSYRNQYDYQFSSSEWMAAYNKFIGGTSAADNGEFGFEVVDGVITQLKGDINNCPSELTLPANATAVYYHLEIPSQVKKLIIPSNITSVKMERQQLENYQNGSDNYDYEPFRNLVNCPARYFSITVFSETTNDLLLESVEVQGNSTVFEVNNNCLYDKDGNLLYIPNNSNITKLTLDYDKVGEYILSRQNFVNFSFSNIREIDCKIGYDSQKDFVVDLFYELAYSIEGGTTLNLDLLTLRIDTSWYEFRSLDSTGSDITIDRINIIGVSNGCQMTFVGAFDFDVNEMYFDNGIGSADVYFIDGATVKDVYFEENVSHFDAMCNDYTLKMHLPWTQYEFEYGGKYALMNMSYTQYQLLQWDYSTNVHERVLNEEEGLSVLYEFLPMSDDEFAEVELMKQFGNIQFHGPNDGCDLGLDYKHAILYGYKGTGSTITVPSDMGGYTVVYLTLTNNTSEGFTPTIDGVTKLVLPDTLLKLELRSDYGEKFYHFDEIEYNGTMDKFKSMFENWELNYVYSICNEVICSDGTLRSCDYEQWQFVDSENSQNKFSVIIDWATWQYGDGYITTLQCEWVYDGQVYTQRQEMAYSTTSFRFMIGEDPEMVTCEMWIALEIDVETRSITITSANLTEFKLGLKVELAFEFVSKEPYYGELLPTTGGF